MRLSKRIIEAIKKSAKESFGSSDVYLFGSRIDDFKVGGDIDLAVDSSDSRIEFRKKKVDFIISMMKLNMDLKFDIVKLNPRDELLANEIKKNAIKI
ncbi:nucleotidyltransferase domain-containing protein [Sulfurospirillum sp. 1307]